MTEDNSWLLCKNTAELRNIFSDANKQYDKLQNSCQISEYFPSKEHAFYKFCTEKLDESKNYVEKLSNILAIRTNEFIDIIFIGHRLVGKSKIINAILMENILPCGSSPTTNCFVEINKSNNEKNYIMCKKKGKKYFDFANLISEIKNKTSTKGDSCCEFNETFHIFLSQSRWNTKLTNGKQSKNIRLIDTPGYDNCKLSSNSNDNSSIEKSIIDRCKIANIIVFVVTHNLVENEKKILEKLFEISSELSIIVLVNKWDLSENDPDEISNASKSNIRNSFKEIKQIHLKGRIYFVSAVEQIKQISAEKNIEPTEFSHERQEAFNIFIQSLNEEINKQNSLKFDISKFEKFYDETKNKYKEYVQSLRGNIKYFINQSDEIKEKFERKIKKIKKQISEKKQKENINLDSSKKFDFIDKLDKNLDSIEQNLQKKLQILYDDFINENYSDYYKHQLQVKQSAFNSYQKTTDKTKNVFKYFGNRNQYNILDKVKSSIVAKVATELSDVTTQNDYFYEKLLQCIDPKLSIITDQINNVSKFFRDYCEFLNTL